MLVNYFNADSLLWKYGNQLRVKQAYPHAPTAGRMAYQSGLTEGKAGFNPMVNFDRKWASGAIWNVAGLLRLFGGFETQVFFDDLRHVFLGHFHEPKTFRPDHHVGAEGADIQATAADDADFAFKVAFSGDLSQFFDDFFRIVIAAGFAFAFAVVDANMQLPHIRLLSFDHENSFEL
jgi:hypothetical protein